MKKARILALATALALLLSMFVGATGLAEAEQDWLEYSVYLGLSDVATFLDNPNDVVTPYVENKFHIRVSEVIQGGLSTIPFKERLATFIAANNMPDVIIGGAEAVAYALNTGYYGEGYQDLIQNHMPNMNAMLDQGYWSEYSNNGKVTQIPNVIVNVKDEPYASDPYIAPPAPWTMWVREDILKLCGYEFEPNKDIFARTTQQGLKPAVEDFKLTPEIKTPDDFRALLEKIKALNMKVGDSDLIPFSSIDWSQFHMGCMFDFGHWRINDAGEVDGFLGSPGAKEYYKFLNGLYRDGLIDPDFIVQTSDQLQAKITSGRVAAGMFAANYPDAQAGLYKTVGPDASIRYISWPKADETGLGAFDVFTPGFWRTVVRSDFAEKERLIEYFDWFFSDEGIDILSWGPE
ncbi:MAG: hypothetical protein GX558_03260, partial [Clostridiales bacterium]|nr:hypothetical protein [Clostridiales bacterium]